MLLRRQSGASQHVIDPFFRGERIHTRTRKKLAQTVEKLERCGQCIMRERAVYPMRQNLRTGIGMDVHKDAMVIAIVPFGKNSSSPPQPVLTMVAPPERARGPTSPQRFLKVGMGSAPARLCAGVSTAVSI